MSYPLQVVLFAVLFGAATLLWFGRDKVTALYLSVTGSQPIAEQARQRGMDKAAPVVVEPVQIKADDVVIEAIATSRAKQSIILYPEVSGEIVEMGIQAGQRVQKGEVILRLNSRLAVLAVDLAQSRLTDAELQLERAESLRQKNVNSGAQVEDAAIRVAQAKLELEQAQVSLKERTLTAPYGGVAGIPKVDVGDRVTTETQILTLDDRTSLYVELEVPEQHLPRVNLEQTISARSPSFNNRVFEGVVSEIDSRIDPVTRAMMVRATLNNTEDLLRPGMSFAVELSLPGKTYPTVPELAVQWRSGESYVWVVRDKKAQKIVVRSVKRLSSLILLDGPIEEGDLVVVEGVHRLREGSDVSYSPPAPTGSGES